MRLCRILPPVRRHRTVLRYRRENWFALSPEDKEDVFILLIRELIASNGGKGLIPVETPEGEALGYYAPPEAARARSERLLVNVLSSGSRLCTLL